MHSLEKASEVCTTPDVSNNSASAEIAAQGRRPGEENWLCSVLCGTPWDQRWGTDSSNHSSSTLRLNNQLQFFKEPRDTRTARWEDTNLNSFSYSFWGEKIQKSPKHISKTQTKPNQTQRAPQNTGKSTNLRPPNLGTLAKQLHGTDILSLDPPGRHNQITISLVDSNQVCHLNDAPFDALNAAGTAIRSTHRGCDTLIQHKKQVKMIW